MDTLIRNIYKISFLLLSQDVENWTLELYTYHKDGDFIWQSKQKAIGDHPILLFVWVKNNFSKMFYVKKSFAFWEEAHKSWTNRSFNFSLFVVTFLDQLNSWSCVFINKKENLNSWGCLFFIPILNIYIKILLKKFNENVKGHI